MEEQKKTRNKSIIINGQKYYTQLTSKFENRKVWENPDPKFIKAMLPSNIEKIYAKEGRSYKKGEVLLSFKAMKMKNTLLMPYTGTVKKIHVKENETVKKEQILIELN